MGKLSRVSAILLLSVGALIGCPPISHTPPTVTSFAIDGDNTSAQTASVTLANACAGKPTEYMVSESANFADASWLAYSEAPSFTFPPGNGIRLLYFKVRNDGGESAVTSDSIILRVPPTVQSFSINAGASTARSCIVTLDNACTGNPTEYMACDGSPYGGTWHAYEQAPSFTLSARNGTRIIYFRTRDAFAESEVVSDTVTLNAPPPSIVSFGINDGAAISGARDVTLNNICSDFPAGYMASESPSFTSAIWQTYSVAPSFRALGNGLRTIYFKTRNEIGESNVATDTIVVNAPPCVLSFSIVDSQTSSTFARDITIVNTGDGDPLEYIASESPTFQGAAWKPYATSAPFTLSAGTGEKTVHFKTRNGYGESERKSDITTLVEPPAITSFTINEGAASTDAIEVTLSSVATNVPQQYMVSESATFVGAEWQSYISVTEFTLSLALGGGPRTVYLRVRNPAGVSTTATASITFNHVEETVMLPGDVPLVLVWIPPTTFLMGNENLSHRVRLARGFWIGKHEVSQKQWKAVVGTEPWLNNANTNNKEDAPATYVSWNEARYFLNSLSIHTGKSFRLPSEAEWEYACRAGTTTHYYWGDDPIHALGGAYAYCEIQRVSDGPCTATFLLPNACELYNMSGNAEEWCEDFYHSSYHDAPTDGSAWNEPDKKNRHVTRGGSFGNLFYECSSSARKAVVAATAEFGNGFRVCR